MSTSQERFAVGCAQSDGRSCLNAGGPASRSGARLGGALGAQGAAVAADWSRPSLEQLPVESRSMLIAQPRAIFRPRSQPPGPQALLRHVATWQGASSFATWLPESTSSSRIHERSEYRLALPRSPSRNAVAPSLRRPPLPTLTLSPLPPTHRSLSSYSLQEFRLSGVRTLPAIPTHTTRHLSCDSATAAFAGGTRELSRPLRQRNLLA